MKNSEILKTHKNHLGGLDTQRRFLLERFSHRCECPVCGHLSNIFEACGKDVDDYDINGMCSAETFHCPGCKATLRYVVPFIAMSAPGWQWVRDFKADGVGEEK